MEDDNYAMIYVTNVKKINGGNIATTEQLYKKMHRELYKQLKYNLKKGSVLMFPSNFMYPHEILEVTKGTRYSIITWFL
jgi:predicted 2-oxoglutarate/Fe(II)-dependent dioxygenase YbiX